VTAAALTTDHSPVGLEREQPSGLARRCHGHGRPAAPVRIAHIGRGNVVQPLTAGGESR
jgi:hypothetical protein